MYPKSHLSLPSRLALVCALVSLGALTVTPPANATTRDFRSWKSAYPDSSTDDNLEDPCALCHKSQTKTSQLNGYGRDYLKEGYDFSAIESLNSDDDETGATNLEEINANTQPGWTEGANNTLYDFDGNTLSTNQSAASISDGTLDPAAGNQAPVADIGGPYSGTENIAVKFDGSNSSDSDGNITGYAWDFGDGSSGSGATVSHTYTATGTYNVTLIVTDDAGDSTTASTQITIGAGNQPPVADANGPYTSVVNEQVQFDGSGSSDPDGSIVSYDWDFGDGSNSSGVKPTHTYTSKGTYNVTLTVTDNSNAVDSIVTSVSVDPANQAPTADPAGPYSAKAGESLVFDGTGSTDPDGSISSYAWDFGDGASGTGANPSHTYTKAGTYNVSLKVTDDAGLSGSAVTTASIGEVDKQAPVANVNGPYTGTVNAQLTFSSNGSKDPDGSIVSYSWDFGDGDTASGADVSHTYTKEGSYNVTLTVEDNDGIQDSASTTAVIGVGNLAPTSDAKGPYSAKVNEAVQFDGSGSQDPDGSIAAYDWDFGDGSSGSGSNPTHSYSEPGTYNVTLTVYDDSGALDADSTTVTVEKEDTDSSTDSAHVGTASIIKKGDWGTGFQGEGVITNDTSDRIGIWSITFDADFTIDQIWHAEIVAHTGNTYVIKAAGWNKAIDPGSTVRFGFIGSPGNQPMPDDITVGDMTQPDPNKDDKSASSTQVTMKNVNDWSTAFQGLTTITNT
ncbi:MAG: PKD domain-containing protein, partial [Candidatus Thiodiazotropha sp.]